MFAAAMCVSASMKKKMFALRGPRPGVADRRDLPMPHRNDARPQAAR